MQSFLNQCFTHNPPGWFLLSFFKEHLKGGKIWIKVLHHAYAHGKKIQCCLCG